MKYLGPEEGNARMEHVECSCGAILRVPYNRYRVDCPNCRRSAIMRELKEEKDEPR